MAHPGLVPLAGCLSTPPYPILLQSIHQAFTPQGWTDRPLEAVELQILNPEHGWVTVRSTRSAAHQTGTDDIKRYFYQVTDARIPAWGWSILAPGQQQAKLRMVRRQDQTLWTSQAQVRPDRPVTANRTVTLSSHTITPRTD